MRELITQEYMLIEDAAGLQTFYDENRGIEWMGFDTEFVGERRYVTLICLIQVATVNGYYLIDPLKVDDLTLFLEMIQDPTILKITHAGENDYRLLHKNYDVRPRNIFDAQVAAGFVGYKYPISFRKLAEKEIKVHMQKGYTVSDWEARPFNKNQLNYALADVFHLYKLWQSLKKKLDELNRYEWVIEELQKFETKAYYTFDPNKEALSSNLIHGLNTQEQIFLIRFYEWRRSEAERKNYSKEMIFPGKLIAPIIRNIRSGRAALRNHRRIPNKIIENNWEIWNDMYQQKASEDERAILKLIPRNVAENPKMDTLMDILNLLLKYQCHEQQIAPELVVNRSNFKKMKVDPNYFDESLDMGWRKELLGEDLINWIKVRTELNIDIVDGKCILSVK